MKRKNFIKLKKDNSLSPCIIVDIDDTVSKMGNRFIYDFLSCMKDKPIESTWLTLSAFANTYDDLVIFFITGRNFNSYETTQKWLEKQFVNYQKKLNKGIVFKWQLYTREEKESYEYCKSKNISLPIDIECKYNIINKHIREKYNPLLAIVDNKNNTKLFKFLGIDTFLFENSSKKKG